MIMTRPTKSPFSPYIPEQIEIKFPSRRVQLGSENPVQCKVKSILKLSTKKKTPIFNLLWKYFESANLSKL